MLVKNSLHLLAEAGTIKKKKKSNFMSSTYTALGGRGVGLNRTCKNDGVKKNTALNIYSTYKSFLNEISHVG